MYVVDDLAGFGAARMVAKVCQMLTPSDRSISAASPTVRELDAITDIRGVRIATIVASDDELVVA